MEKRKEIVLKNLPVKDYVHARIVNAAKARGMTIQGLTERILIAWCNEKNFDQNVAQSNNAPGN